MCSSTMKGGAVSQTHTASPPKSNEKGQGNWLFLFLSFFLLSNSINAQRSDFNYRTQVQTNALVAACDAPPSPNAACTPPNSYDVDINLQGETLIWDEGHSQLDDCQDFTQVARITGCGTVLIPDDLNLQFNSSGAILVIDGPDLIVNGGNFQMDESGSKFIMNGGALRIFGDFQQTENTVQCITGTSIEVGEEDADEGFTSGQFNNSSDTQSSANWQNDGGYRYLKDCCINVTQDYQLQSSGSGTGTNGVDVIIGCCIEIGDRGENNATSTAFGVSDGDDSGNFQNSNRMYIFDTDIVVANGDFQSSNNTITACNMDVKLNKSGNFQINSGTLEGDGLCIAAEDQIENSGTWTANISSWYSDKNNSLSENNPITGTTPAESNTVPDCFEGCCLEDDCVIPDPVIVVTCDTKDNADPSDDMFSYTIQVANPDPGCSTGSYSITGDDTQNDLDYDQVNGPYGPFMASNGSLSITITDDSDSDCSTDAEVVPDCPQDPCEGKDCDDGCPYTVDTCDPNTGECINTLVEPDCDDNCPYTTDEYNEATCECENTLVTPDCDDNCPYTTDEYNEATCECENTLVTPDCDDNCPYTTDEYNEATCECENTLVTPDCDDSCPYTTDEYNEATCECENTLVTPDCDDNDCTTEDSYNTETCECENTAITPTPDCESCPPGTSPSYSGGVTADGNSGEWDLTNDFFANMYEAGNPTKQLLSKAYLRYDCSTNTLCILVLTEIDVTADQVASEAWVKVYDISNSTQIDGNSSDFAWVPNQMGWEGCFSLAEASYDEIEIHVNVTWDGESGRTSSTGKGGQGNAIPLCIECPDDPCEGKDCDDGCPYTVDTCDPNTGECINTLQEPDCDDQDCTTNDYFDADICECVNEPITPPSCDDEDCTTNDYYDTDICECVNEPITPPSCDDEDCTTNDYYDTDICECVNEPITPPSCDDEDCTTNDYYDTDICECVNEPITPPSCDDEDCTTNDYYDTDICECVNEPITPPSCDDEDCTTNDYYDTDICECVNEPITPLSCDDEDCTTNDYYDTDICECVNEPITPPSCDDEDCTTNDYYDTDICECVNEPITPPSCDDGKCTTNDYYDEDICECVNEPITPPSCNDHDCTTNDYYDEDLCECVNEPITPPNCDDGSECTRDYYDAENCECVNEPIVCDDGDPCTRDYCDPHLGCVFEPIDDLSCGEGTIDCEGQTEATYDPDTESYTLYADGCWHDCLSPDRDVHFYQELCGDGELIARVASISGSGHAGIVMRESVDPVARRAGVMTKLYSNSVRREYRESYGAPVHQMLSFRPGVEWFRMIRKGNQIKVYTSEHGDYWRLLYKITYPNLASCLQTGLMAYSSSGGTDITAVFDNVQLIPASSSFGVVEEIFVPGKLSTQDHTPVQFGQNDPRVRIEIANEEENIEKLEIYPNPAKDEAFVTIPRVEGAQQALLVLYNSTGQEVLRRRVDPGITRTELIRLNELDAGVYVFRLMIDGKKDLSQRLVISK